VGPLLMTGLSCFGAAVALGLISTGTWPPDEAPVSRQAPTGRSLAIIFMAFSMGTAVLGTVVGLLAIFVARDVADPADGLLAAGPAVIGGIIALALVARQRGAGDPRISTLAAVYILNIVGLGTVVALLALFIVEGPARDLAGWPFVILGLINGASALATGATGATAVRAMRGVDEQTRKAIAQAQISRSGLIQIPFVAASAIAIALIVLG
jgi:hypothetical protein